jgi:SAM-dependent methyltransferase
MAGAEQFAGKPWGADPSPRWNQASYWDDSYRNLLANPHELHRRAWVVYREMFWLVRLLPALGEIPRGPSSPQQTLLDAGCGVSLIPHVLAYWGFQVTAVDLSAQAVEWARRQEPDEVELARCIPAWEVSASGMSATMLEDPEQSLAMLREYRSYRGSLRFLHCDWKDDSLPAGGFGLIYCRNSLRCATKPYWRQSLQRFHDLLAPGGILLLETLNAIDIREEVEEMIREQSFTFMANSNPGFQRVAREQPAARASDRKDVLADWSTG